MYKKRLDRQYKTREQNSIYTRSNAIKLLRMIGCPGVPCYEKEVLKESNGLYELAFQNRLAPLYLKILKERSKLKRFKKFYKNFLKRYEKSNFVISHVSSILNAQKVPYVLIKTIRPFFSTPNDVDLLYLGEKKDLQRVIQLLISIGYKKSNEQRGEIGFWDPDRPIHNPRTGNEMDYIDLDLYREIMVKDFSYFDKNKLRSYIVEQKLANGLSTFVLSPPIDLAFVILHSVFPNRSYGLEIFYTTMNYFNKFTNDDLNLLLRFAMENHLNHVLCTSFDITIGLSIDAFGFVDDKILFVRERLRRKGAFSLPDRFPYIHPLNVFFKAGISRLTHRKALISLIFILFRSFNPYYTLGVFRELLSKSEAKKRYQLNY